jgi:hypothetical protein
MGVEHDSLYALRAVNSRRSRWLSIGLVFAVHACRTAEEGPALTEEARVVLEAHCGQCHVGAYETALPRALAVFDLSEATWSTRMTDAQLRSARWRLSEPLGPDGEKIDVSAHDVDVFRRFVDGELARRDALNSHNPQTSPQWQNAAPEAKGVTPSSRD